MATYYVRVELTGAKPEDYLTLHRELEDKGYKNEVKAVSEKLYKLPKATYRVSKKIEGEDDAEKRKNISKEVYLIAKNINKDPAVLVILSRGASFNGLAVIEE